MASELDAPHDAPSDQAAIDAAWNAELRKRIDEVESGAVESVDGEETMLLARELIDAKRTQAHG
jgi:hypothetical protein